MSEIYELPAPPAPQKNKNKKTLALLILMKSQRFFTKKKGSVRILWEVGHFSPLVFVSIRTDFTSPVYMVPLL